MHRFTSLTSDTMLAARLPQRRTCRLACLARFVCADVFLSPSRSIRLQPGDVFFAKKRDDFDADPVLSDDDDDKPKKRGNMLA